ncbi:RlpA-like double-psi beta-barrel-protein domain-containing protein-containing protein [Mycena galericulata]|nr:RlpA-like double-psi beta-barrel-protein domain-containing protein-containing protein [Mycena galericulata]
MFSFASSTVLALVVASAFCPLSLSRPVVTTPLLLALLPPRDGLPTTSSLMTRTTPVTWFAIDCEAKHNTTFFGACCHPLLATETLQANRPACCAPGATAVCPGEASSAVSSAAAPAETSTEEEECDDGGDDEDDGDDEDCEDEGESSSAVATSTPVEAAAPAPTTTSKAAPKVTSTEAAPKVTSTTQAAPPKTPHRRPPPPASSDSGEFTTGGVGTWFTQNGVAGACGTVHSDTALIVALQTKTYDNGANCGRTIEIVDVATGKSQTATVADECPTCNNAESVDMSEGLFQGFATLSVGEFNIKWRFTS